MFKKINIFFFHQKMSEIKENENQINYSHESIKSKYILMKILSNLKETKLLTIIKYCKKIQNRLEVTLEDYKNYAKIEIELDVGWDLCLYKKKEFINIPSNQRKCFHFFF